MKILSTISIFLFSFLLLTTSSCKDDDFDIEELTGNLIVNAKDGLNNSLGSGNTVYLYRNEADFNNRIYSEKKTTNSNGQVKFINLDPGVYYASSEFENQLGFDVEVTGSGSVSAGFETTITIKP